jgi:hypothetical protein
MLSHFSAIINLHIHPTDITAIEHTRQITETHGPHNGQVHDNTDYNTHNVRRQRYYDNGNCNYHHLILIFE